VSQPAALILTIGIIAADVALVLACRFVEHEPFVTLDRWLADIWQGIYRGTGAQALDRKLVRRTALRDMAVFGDLAERLDGAGLGASADRCRDAAATAAARVGN
jgi:hypothetical protein